DADAPRLTRGQAGGTAQYGRLPQRAECRQRGQAGKAAELLAGSAFEIRSDEQRYPGALVQLPGERCRRLRGSAKEDEAAYTELERPLDGRTVSFVAAHFVPPDRR